MATKQPAEEQEAPPVNKAPGKRPHITEKSLLIVIVASLCRAVKDSFQEGCVRQKSTQS